MNLIVSVDQEWGIGRENELLVRIPADMKQFREKTVGNTIVMGRKTLESFPGGKPLKDRRNIVLTRDPAYQAEGVTVLNGPEALAEELKAEDHDRIFVVGGGEIYNLLLPQCEKAFITKLKGTFPADTYFHNLDQDTDWELESESEEQVFEGLVYTYCLYRRKSR